MADEQHSTLTPEQLAQLADRLYKSADSIVNVAALKTADDMRTAARCAGELAYLREAIRGIAERCGGDDVGTQLINLLKSEGE